MAPSVTRRMYSCGSHGHTVRLAPLTVTQEQIEERFTEQREITVKEKPILYLVRTVHLPDLERISKEELGDLATVRTEQEKTGRELGRILSDATRSSSTPTLM